jgi:sugar transferase (PEP-CTERM system associated)
MFRIFSQYVSVKAFLLAIFESIVITISVFCAVRLRFWNDPDDLAAYIVYPDFLIQCGTVLIVCLMCFYYNDLYDSRSGFGATERFLRIEQSIGAASLILGLIYFLMPGLLLSRGVFLIAMLLVAFFVLLGRKLLDSAWRLTVPLQHVIILGTGALAQDLAREITLRNDLTIRLDGFVSATGGPEASGTVVGLPVLGSAKDMEAIARDQDVSRIIVALEDRRGSLPTRDLVSLRVRGVYIEDAANALAALTGRVSLHVVRPSWFVFSEGFHRSKWQGWIKRLFDLFFGTLGMLLSLPVMLVVALAVRLDSKGPVIYRQTRVGRGNRHFELIKFRSMRQDAEKINGAQWAVDNDPRVTRVGRFLRLYRLDELPQFFNVIRGDMSFVGPRPERPCFVTELRKTIPYYDERHSERPGITGWAQVKYPYGSSVKDAFHKLEYDLFYLKNMSLAFDMGIVLETIRIVISGKGAK